MVIFPAVMACIAYYVIGVVMMPVVRGREVRLRDQLKWFPLLIMALVIAVGLFVRWALTQYRIKERAMDIEATTMICCLLLGEDAYVVDTLDETCWLYRRGYSGERLFIEGSPYGRVCRVSQERMYNLARSFADAAS